MVLKQCYSKADNIHTCTEHMGHMHVHVPAHPQNRSRKCHDIYQLLQKITRTMYIIHVHTVHTVHVHGHPSSDPPKPMHY